MIQSANKKKLSDHSNLPNVQVAVDGWLHKTKVGVVQKSQVDGYTQEITLWQEGFVNVQPMNESMAIKKEGERSWKWYVIYCKSDLDLKTDAIVEIFNLKYRIMEKKNWSHHGFFEYHAIEDYKGEY